MRKELVISIIILTLIIGLNYITQNNTSKSVDNVTKILQNLRQEVLEENPDYEKVCSHSEEAYNKWEEEDDTIAYYIEHNEIEKVNTALTSVKSFIEVKEYSQSLEVIDKCIYILEHIEEKELVTLDNIF